MKRIAILLVCFPLAACKGGDGRSWDPELPQNRFIDWDPGVRGGIPDLAEVCPPDAPSVLDFGAVADGTTDDAPAFQAAIDAAAEGSSIRIPAGTYLLNEGLDIDSGIVLCGAGPDVTRLDFDCDDAAIDVVTYDRGEYVDVTAGHDQGSTLLALSDATSFTPGGYAELKQTNNWNAMDPEGEWRHASWVPEDAVGQMLRIVDVSGNDVTVEPALGIDYDAGWDPVLRPLGLVEGAGIQGLHLRRTGTQDHATISLKNAANVWIRDIVSEDTCTSHVGTNSVLWCEIRDSYFHHSHDYGGGGHGYGTNLGNHTTACLVENNVFEHLRHSMLVQVGATANVFGYNYSTDPFTDEGDWSPCDVSLHGHYPNMNLFEGNTVAEIDVSDYWGPCGPGNTFLRNRTTAEGIQIMDHSHYQNVIGNELSTDPNVVSTDSTVLDTLIHGNHQDGSISWDPTIDDHSIPDSLYLESRPAFFGSTDWPVTGADLAPDGGRIPAQQRYDDM